MHDLNDFNYCDRCRSYKKSMSSCLELHPFYFLFKHGIKKNISTKFLNEGTRRTSGKIIKIDSRKKP